MILKTKGQAVLKHDSFLCQKFGCHLYGKRAITSNTALVTPIMVKSLWYSVYYTRMWICRALRK